MYRIILFFSTIESEESIGKSSRMIYSSVTTFVFPLKMKPSRQDTIERKAFFTQKSNYEQVSSRGLGFVHCAAGP